MNIFMLGWEFPPFISGGLGTACYGLTRAMNELGHRVIFILPQPVTTEFATHVELRTPAGIKGGFIPGVTSYRLDEFQNVEFKAIPAMLQPYGEGSPMSWQEFLARGGNLVSETSAGTHTVGGINEFNSLYHYVSACFNI